MLISAPRPECTTDPECPDHLACIQERCQDPCTTLACGINAQCSVNNHRATCTCRRGFIGDPFTVCRERKDYLNFIQFKYHSLTFSVSQLAVRVIQSVISLLLAMTENARNPACMRTVVWMLSAVPGVIVLFAHANPITSAILMTSAGLMNVWLTRIALQHKNVRMRSVLTHASVLDSQIALQEITEVIALAYLIILETPMGLLAHQVSCQSKT